MTSSEAVCWEWPLEMPWGRLSNSNLRARSSQRPATGTHESSCPGMGDCLLDQADQRLWESDRREEIIPAPRASNTLFAMSKNSVNLFVAPSSNSTERRHSKSRGVQTRITVGTETMMSLRSSITCDPKGLGPFAVLSMDYGQSANTPPAMPLRL